MKLDDLTGRKFGMLTVTNRADRNYISPSGVVLTQWECVCECGNSTVVTGTNLKAGRTNSCGCMSTRTTRNIAGKKFGRLTAVELSSPYISESGTKRTRWRCVCDCGNKVIVQSRYLTNGSTRSCGCLQNEINSSVHTTHGGSNSRLYNIWSRMKDRCSNPNNSRYNRYGGRGITVCADWKDDFESFREWAFANGYDDSLSIDRINNAGNYEPANCRWATAKEQANNRGESTNEFIFIKKYK